MKSFKSAKQNIWRLVMILERSRLKIPEATKDVTEGEIMFPGLKTCYMEANTQNDGKMEIYAAERTHRRPKHGPYATRNSMHPKHALGSPSIHFRHTQAPRAWLVRPEHFLLVNHAWEGIFCCGITPLTLEVCNASEGSDNVIYRCILNSKTT